MHIFKDKKARSVSETELDETESGKTTVIVILFVLFVIVAILIAYSIMQTLSK